jgi:hypothetical protein
MMTLKEFTVELRFEVELEVKANTEGDLQWCWNLKWHRLLEEISL